MLTYSIFNSILKSVQWKRSLSGNGKHLLKLKIFSGNSSLNKKRYSSITSTSQVENCNVGTLGHIDHGKTTLTAALTKYCSKVGKSKYVSYEDIDHAPEEKSRGITINIYHVGYSTSKRRYAHTDCPGHSDYVKNMISGTSQMDGAILVVAATDGEMPQTREHLLLAKQIGLQKMIVFINKADLVGTDVLELVELEIRDLLETYGFDGMNAPVIVGSALLALKEDQSKYGELAIQKLLDALDSYIEIPGRDVNAPFYFPLDNYLTILGRGTVIIGTLKQGTIKLKDKGVLVGYNQTVPASVGDIQIFHKSVEKAAAGDHCGILVKGLKKEDVRRGMVFCKPNSIELNNHFEADLYLLTENEANRKMAPISSKFTEYVMSETWWTVCRVDLPADMTMLMPGEHAMVTMVFVHQMPVLVGQRFTIRSRESRVTIAIGMIKKIKNLISYIPPRKLRTMEIPV